VPVPVKVTVWGEPVALSATDSVAAKEPVSIARSRTLIEQLALTASSDGQLSDAIKSCGFAPPMLRVVIESAPVPELVSDTV